MNARPLKKGKGQAGAVDRFILRFGHFLSWANFLLIFVIVLQVILRYGFGRGMVALEELEWHLYAVAFMFGLSYAVVTDAHVRVDLISSRMSPSRRAHGLRSWALRFCCCRSSSSSSSTGGSSSVSSWVRHERSLAPMGLPYRWAIKAVIPLSFILFGLAALTRLIRTIQQLKGPSDAAQ
ncbi:MAG: TRAP transporter small permease subunit [Desulfobacterales bacterium]|nr:TRAP transporter small permease subunit [Desulfobacterales bacterium]